MRKRCRCIDQKVEMNPTIQRYPRDYDVDECTQETTIVKELSEGHVGHNGGDDDKERVVEGQCARMTVERVVGNGPRS